MRQIIEKLMKIAVDYREADENVWFSMLIQAGVSETDADNAIRFAPIAFGRILLHGMEIRFPKNFMRLNANGAISTEGLLEEQPAFVAAKQIASSGVNRSQMEALALRSSEVNAINQALKAGSQTNNLVLAPIIIFDETPTPLGINKAQLIIKKHPQESVAPKVAPNQKKTWWKIW